MNKTACLIILFLIGSIAAVSAEVSKEDPYFGVGSEFLVVGTGNPEIFTLFDNTHIYLDNNNDGIWDYQFQGNSGESQTLNPPWPVNRGARIQTDKPIMYKQLTYENRCSFDPCDTFFYTIVPPLNNLESEYYFIHDIPSWPLYIIAPENTTIIVDEYIDGAVDQTFNVEKVQAKSFFVNNFSKVYSEENKKFYVYDQFSLIGPKGTDFYTNWNSIKILVAEDDTQINIDMNNDLAYDETHMVGKGVHDYSVTKGAHVNVDKPIALFSSFDRYADFPIMPSDMLNNDLWGETGGYQYGRMYLIGLFDTNSGPYTNTTYKIDYQSQNDLMSDYNGTLYANEIFTLTSLGNIHLWANMPLNYFYYLGPEDGYRGHNRFLPSYSYSRVYPITYSEEKYIGSEDDLIINARVFNPFAATSASDFNVKLRFNDLFAFPAIFTVEVNKKNLNTDAVVSSDTITKFPVLISGQYEFVVDSSDSSLLNSLGPFEYYEIKYNLISPLAYGFYDFEPVEITYNAPTWEMPI